MSVLENEYMFYQSSDIPYLIGRVYKIIISYNKYISFHIKFIDLYETYDCYIYEDDHTHDYTFKAISLLNNEKAIFGTIKRGQTNFSETKFKMFNTEIECDSIQNTLDLKIIPHLLTYFE